MPHADQSPFAARMMAKGRPEGLNSDANHRLFFDPPEMIQMAFGGRQWFFAMGNIRVHRVGLFKGLGWEFDPNFLDGRGITGVRITARPYFAVHNKPLLCDMEFMERRIDYDEAGYQSGYRERVIDHRPGLELHQLKPAYAEVLGNHAV